MSPNISALVGKYRERGILLDTNLFLVMLAGNVDRRLIGTAAGTKGYKVSDYERLRVLLGHFDRYVVLPQILTEAGNFFKRNCPTEKTLLDLRLEMARWIGSPQTREMRVLSSRVTEEPAYIDLGYADAAILNAAAKRKFLVLTVDGKLEARAYGMGLDVLPFDWLRIF